MIKIIQLVTAVINSARVADWTSTAASAVALGVYVANIAGYGVPREIAEGVTNAAIAIIGFFTARRALNNGQS